MQDMPEKSPCCWRKYLRWPTRVTAIRWENNVQNFFKRPTRATQFFMETSRQFFVETSRQIFMETSRQFFVETSRQIFMETSRRIFMKTSRLIFMETSRRIFMEHRCEPHINAVNITYEHHGVFFMDGNITANFCKKTKICRCTAAEVKWQLNRSDLFA